MFVPRVLCWLLGCVPLSVALIELKSERAGESKYIIAYFRHSVKATGNMDYRDKIITRGVGLLDNCKGKDTDCLTYMERDQFGAYDGHLAGNGKTCPHQVGKKLKTWLAAVGQAKGKALYDFWTGRYERVMGTGLLVARGLAGGAVAADWPGAIGSDNDDAKKNDKVTAWNTVAELVHGEGGFLTGWLKEYLHSYPPPGKKFGCKPKGKDHPDSTFEPRITGKWGMDDQSNGCQLSVYSVTSPINSAKKLCIGDSELPTSPKIAHVAKRADDEMQMGMNFILGNYGGAQGEFSGYQDLSSAHFNFLMNHGSCYPGGSKCDPKIRRGSTGSCTPRDAAILGQNPHGLGRWARDNHMYDFANSVCRVGQHFYNERTSSTAPANPDYKAIIPQCGENQDVLCDKIIDRMNDLCWPYFLRSHIAGHGEHFVDNSAALLLAAIALRTLQDFQALDPFYKAMLAAAVAKNVAQSDIVDKKEVDMVKPFLTNPAESNSGPKALEDNKKPVLLMSSHDATTNGVRLLMYECKGLKVKTITQWSDGSPMQFAEELAYQVSLFFHLKESEEGMKLTVTNLVMNLKNYREGCPLEDMNPANVLDEMPALDFIKEFGRVLHARAHKETQFALVDTSVKNFLDKLNEVVQFGNEPADGYDDPDRNYPFQQQEEEKKAAPPKPSIAERQANLAVKEAALQKPFAEAAQVAAELSKKASPAKASPGKSL